MDLSGARVLDRFDTPLWLSNALIGALPGNSPRAVLDLGSGGGALSAAAARRWTTSNLFTVDVDTLSISEVTTALIGTRGRHRHIVADALSPFLDQSVGLSAGTVDIILSNPPYRMAKWTPSFEVILDRAGLSRHATTMTGVTLDLIFLAQALYFIKPGGHLGLIVPDTFVTGARMAGVRQALVEMHAVERVVQLPRGAFRGTDAQAYILIVRAGQPGTRIALDRVDRYGRWYPPIFLPSTSELERLDYSYHEARIRPECLGRPTLREMGAVVSRGRSSSVVVRSNPGVFFHTSNFPCSVGSPLDLNSSASAAHAGELVAEEGDILLARVDRRLERKIAYVRSGSSPISDCVFRLRCPPNMRETILAGLCSDAGQDQLLSRSRGVGARSLSASDLLSIHI